MTAQTSMADRSISALAAAGITLALGYGFLLALAFHPSEARDDPLKLIELLPLPPPEKTPERVEPRPADSKPEGEAAPPNLRAEPTEIVAPRPPVPVPPPLPTAPVAGTGHAPSAGSADIAGPGTGAGGAGDGRGSGGSGDGWGSGGEETPPIWRRGRIRDSDYPDALGESGTGGTVSVRYTVWTDGRVIDCEVTRSSGNRILDVTTCRLIRERFRFEPSRDARGRPVPAVIVEDHQWVVEPDYGG